MVKGILIFPKDKKKQGSDALACEKYSNDDFRNATNVIIKDGGISGGWYVNDMSHLTVSDTQIVAEGEPDYPEEAIKMD